jgi:hypothetical protein
MIFRSIQPHKTEKWSTARSNEDRHGCSHLLSVINLRKQMQKLILNLPVFVIQCEICFVMHIRLEQIDLARV